MVYLFLAEGFEEIEAITVIDTLRRAEIDVKTVSITDSLEVIGGHAIKIEADTLFEDEDFRDAECIVLPGGMPGTTNLAKFEELNKLIIEKYKEKKLITAICAAPSILGQIGILKDKEAICYPGFEKNLKGAKLKKEKVVISDNIITSKGPGTAHNFALAIVTKLKDKETAEKLNKEMLFKRKFAVTVKEM